MIQFHFFVQLHRNYLEPIPKLGRFIHVLNPFIHALSGDEFLHEISQYLPAAAIEMDAIDVESPAVLLPDLIQAPMEYEDFESGSAHG